MNTENPNGKEKPTMAPVTVTCDRCHERVEGFQATNMPQRSWEYTARFVYVAHQDSAWRRYANPGESILCEACLLADPRWQAMIERMGTPEVSLAESIIADILAR